MAENNANYIKCTLCNNFFKANSTGYSLHLKSCTVINELQAKKQKLYHHDILQTVHNQNKSASTSSATIRSSSPSIMQKNSSADSFIIVDNIIDHSSSFLATISNTDSQLVFENENDEIADIQSSKRKALTPAQLELVNQEKEFQTRMKNSHQIWSNKDLGKLELLKILFKHKCPNSAYEEIFGWALHYNNLPDSNIFEKGSKIQRRDAFLKDLQRRRNMEAMKPILKKVEVVQSTKNKKVSTIDVTTFDFKQQLLALLRDQELMKPENLVLPEPGEKPTFSNKISEIQDSEWYMSTYQYYNKKMGMDKNRVICGIILTVDKTHTDWKGKLCLEPVQFTLSIFNTETRKKKASAWKCLGFINDLDAYRSSKFYTGNEFEDVVGNRYVNMNDDCNEVTEDPNDNMSSIVSITYTISLLIPYHYIFLRFANIFLYEK